MPLSAEDAIKKFNVELLEKLPLEDVIFFAKAKTANLFPLGTADSIEAKPTRAEKVAYFLQHVVEPGAKEYLPKLLIVMKDSKNDTVVELAGKIEAAMTPWPATTSTASMPKGKELDFSDDTTASTSSVPKGKKLDSSDDTFDCTAAAERLRKDLKALSKLNYDDMETSLFGKKVITQDQRTKIEHMIGRKKMEYLIVDIIIPSLQVGLVKKYTSFLESMEESEDDDLQATAKTLRIKDSPSSSTVAVPSPVAVNVPSTFSEVKLFISYAWEDSTNDFVKKLREDLENEGFRQVFLDKVSILPGDNIQHTLSEELDKANGIIAVDSEKYRVSKWCDNEILTAERKGKQIFPVRRTKEKYNDNLDRAIGGIKWVDFTDDDKYQDSFQSLIAGIRKNCMKKANNEQEDDKEPAAKPPPKSREKRTRSTSESDVSPSKKPKHQRKKFNFTKRTGASRKKQTSGKTKS